MINSNYPNSNFDLTKRNLWPSWFNRFFKISVGVFAIAAPLTTYLAKLAGSQAGEGGSATIIFALAIGSAILLGIIISILLLILGWRGLVHKSTLFAGVFIKGIPAVIAGLLLFLIGLISVICTIGLIFLQIFLIRDAIKLGF